MRIRPATDKDAEAVAGLWTEAYTGAGPGGRSTPYAASEFLDSARHGQPFVALDGEELVGVVVFHAPLSSGKTVARDGEAELARLAVAASARRHGVGRALTELCTELARETGAGAIALWSRPYQVAGHRLYESLGYRPRPERDDTDADGRRLIFVLDLDGATAEAGKP
jgi:ribosomal protein S18 acetylase RimI-like enzyme